MFIRSLCLSLALANSVNSALVTYIANITKGNTSPDGRTRVVCLREVVVDGLSDIFIQAWLINGKTPGAPLIANQGDQVSVQVNNKGDEPITIQFVFILPCLP